MKLIQRVTGVTAITLLVLVVLMFVLGIYYFGMTGLFVLLGVQFDTYLSLFWFVVLYYLTGIVFDFLSMVLIQIVRQSKQDQRTFFLYRMATDCTCSWFALHLTDEMMRSVTIPLPTEILVALVFFLIEVAFERS